MTRTLLIFMSLLLCCPRHARGNDEFADPAVHFVHILSAPLHGERAAKRLNARADTPHLAPAGAFADDTTLSEPVRAAIQRSARDLGSSQGSLPLQLLIPGYFSADELPPRAEGEWYAMTVSASSASFVPVRVHLRKIKNPRPTGDLSIPGAAVETEAPDSVLFLVRGRHWSRRSSVPTWFIGDAILSPGDSISLSGPRAGRWSVIASKPQRLRHSGSFGFQIEVRDRATGRFQSLGGWPVGLSPIIRWVGDLDGDARADLFLYDPSHESGERNWVLYLSGLAKGKSLFGKAAELYTPGC